MAMLLVRTVIHIELIKDKTKKCYKKPEMLAAHDVSYGASIC